jgi:hypothetical protein
MNRMEWNGMSGTYGTGLMMNGQGRAKADPKASLYPTGGAEKLVFTRTWEKKRLGKCLFAFWI